MPDEIRVNRPMHQQPRPEYSGAPMEQEMAAPAKSSKMPWLVLVVVVVVIIVLALLFRDKLFGGSAAGGPSMTKTSQGSSGYQAVFLTNGQVYFGQISDPDGDYATLKDIYYLQVGPQQGSGAATNTPQSISLVKLGNELHGPVDEMHISRTQILFYEDLKADGSVVTAIMKDKASKAAAPAATPAGQQVPAVTK